jgi:hypothetical protein
MLHYDFDESGPRLRCFILHPRAQFGSLDSLADVDLRRAVGMSSYPTAIGIRRTAFVVVRNCCRYRKSLLVRGDALEACQSWLKQRKAGAPEISDLVQAFLNASVEAETARTRKERQQLDDMAREQARTARAQRVTKWALAAFTVAVALGLGLVGWEYKANFRPPDIADFRD